MFIKEEVADGQFTSEKNQCCVTWLIENVASGVLVEQYVQKIIRSDFFFPKPNKLFTKTT